MRENIVLLEHGAGGRASQEFIARIFEPLLQDQALRAMDDCAVLPPPKGRICLTTDSFVVDPVIFPGGNIGSLAVHGTVNDAAMRGGRPLWLTAGFVLEEGLSLDLLAEIVAAMARALAEAGVSLVAADTKVVARGQADKLFINTTGLSVVPPGLELGADRAAPGDAVLLSGSLGDHGAAIMTARQGLNLQAPILSDSACLAGLIQELLAACSEIHVLRDPTRGGLATALNEIAQASAVSMELEESLMPVKPAVAGVCELLGLDPFYLANEGKLICILPQKDAHRALRIMRSHSLGGQAEFIGQVLPPAAAPVWLKTRAGGKRIMGMLSGDILPRIC